MPKAHQTIYLGESEPVYFTFYDNDGDLTNVDNARVDINDPSGTALVTSANMTNVSTGLYYYNFDVSTAITTAEGLYQAWPHGWSTGIRIFPDGPRYIEIISRPVGTGYNWEFLESVRRHIGDNDASDYRFTTYELAGFIKDATEKIKSKYNTLTGNTLSITVTANSQGISFDSTPSDTTSDLIKRQVAILIMEYYLQISISKPGIINAGDLKLNIVGSTKTTAEEIKRKQSELDKELKYSIRRGLVGYRANTYGEGLNQDYSGDYYR